MKIILSILFWTHTVVAIGQGAAAELDPEELSKFSMIKEFKIKKIETSYYEVGDSALNRVPIKLSVEEYDLLGRLTNTKIWTQNGELSEKLTYDSYGRLMTKTTSRIDDGKLLYVYQDTLTYDSIDGGRSMKSSFRKENRVELFDNSGRKYRVEYFKIRVDTISEPYQILEWRYDQSGRAIEISDKSVTLSLAYDKLGNITSKKWSSEKEPDKSFGFDYVYDGVKLISKRALSQDSIALSFKYKDGLLTEIHHPYDRFTTIDVLKYEFY